MNAKFPLRLPAKAAIAAAAVLLLVPLEFVVYFTILNEGSK